MARWCVHTRQSPDVYLRLTLLERNEFTKAANEMRGA